MDLQTLWFFLWGLLWALFFVTDGFDFGVGMLYPFITENEADKKDLIKSIGPLWNGNQVWLIAAGGITFAAFPDLYAVMFSSLYTVLMIVLFALIIRGVAFEFREQSENRLWRKTWDIAFFAGSFLPALLFGILFSNLFCGLPINAEKIYTGNLFTLLNPYAMLGGIFFILLFLQHGSLWLCIRTSGKLKLRTKNFASKIWLPLLITAVLFLIYTAFKTTLYDNYIKMPLLFIVLIAAVAGLISVKILIAKEKFFKAFISSSVAILSVTFFGVIGLYPNMFISKTNSSYSLTAFNSSSSPLTLKIMLIVVIIFIPLILLYQGWAFSLFKNRLTKKDLSYHNF